MATFMEKDVLLELSNNGIAECFNQNDKKQLRSKLWKIKDYLYATEPKEIDYDSCLKEIKTIRGLK